MTLVRCMIVLTAVLGLAAPAAAWNLDLADTVVVDRDRATVADVAGGPVPAAAAGVTVLAGGVPGTSAFVSQRMILRHLVSAGVASGVRLGGARQCVIVFAGQQVGTGQLTDAARRAVQPLVPAARPGAPDSWLEIDIPERGLPAASDQWRVVVRRTQPLEPGRNTVRFELDDGVRSHAFPGTVVLHAYDEIGAARLKIDRGMPLDEDQFNWQWQDLATAPSGVAVGRAALAGASAARTLSAGDALRQSDLKDTPVILAGDAVDLRIIRGSVQVTVRCVARQPGTLGQTIPVRNELNGRLVNARVAGPGVVEWRR